MMKLEDSLGVLAMQYRGTRNQEIREEVARKYALVVFELVESGIWECPPAFEDMLPMEAMPEIFFQYWGMR